VTGAEALPVPLDGLRILELADEKGQFCGKLLGDLGAEVVKIEPPGGEPCRRVGPFLDDIPHPERSLSFWYYMIIGASTVVQQASRRGAPKGSWLAQMLARKPKMLVTVALANKMARVMWALLVKGGNYKTPAAAA
jgi:hypothetical protein